MRAPAKMATACAVVASVVWGCVEPKPKSLTLPTQEDAERDVRRAMAAFNEDRFDMECAAIDSLLAKDPSASVAMSLGGGMRLVPELEGVALHATRLAWKPVAGDRVTWQWTARSLQGDSLTSGVNEFAVELDPVPRVFHEAAKNLGHAQAGRVWSPSVSAFGVRGIPGEIPPFTPLQLDVEQRRSVRDSAWWAGVRRGEESEAVWLDQFVRGLSQPEPAQERDGIWVQVHSTQERSLQSGEPVLLRIRTSEVRGGTQRESAMEWNVGTPDQIVPALQAALESHPAARTLTVWSASKYAFGEDGVDKAGIPPRTPLRFEVEVLPL
jgi:FKBP-type peptidyl-prolyl cis-trans isomerase